MFKLIEIIMCDNGACREFERAEIYETYQDAKVAIITLQRNCAEITYRIEKIEN